MNEFNLDTIPRIPFCNLPTPIQYLERLSDHVGKVDIYIKRDDLTGIAFGGNKNRKLEFLLAKAKRKGFDVVITEGAVTSNHCLQTAACAAKLGFEYHLVLSDAFIGEKATGNYLLDMILDAKIHRVSASDERKNKMEEIVEQLRNENKKPYIIPTGGSTYVGFLGYVKCMQEIEKQSKEMNIDFDYFVFGTGSAGTQAGMLVGKKLFYPEIDIIGVSAGDSKMELTQGVKRIIENFNHHYQQQISIKAEEIKVLEKYYGEGYGIPTQELKEIVKLVAKLEGIFLDPVYNGKAMVGLLDLIESGEIPEGSKVLFLHSGGSVALFVYDEFFSKK
jgi:D-cysteine desulfhydrase family pyridoxal phosphate-dependent enzyme